MEHPVDTKKRFSIYSSSQAKVIKDSVAWPRDDGGEIIGADPDLVFLLRVDQQPDYNPHLETVRPNGWTVDLAAETYTCNYAVTQVQTQKEFDDLKLLEADRATKKANLFLDLKTRLATDLGIQVESPADLSGKIEEIIPAARLKRDSKATTGDRLNELEKQVELLTTFVALLSRS